MNCQNLKQKYEELLTLREDFQAVNAEFQKMKPNSVSERRAVSDELQRKQENITKFIQENFDSILCQDRIIKSEKKALEEFFGQSIDVPKIPKEITNEKIKNWEKIGFKLRYLPAMDMSEEKEYPGWKDKPDSWFYERIKERNNLPIDCHIIKAGWILVDERSRPNHDVKNCNQMYEDDPLGQIIIKLREQGSIDDYRKPESRFNIKGSDLDKTEVKAAFAKILNVNENQISLPRAIEYNTLGNLHYKEWGTTDTWEWFQDLGRNDLSGQRLTGGFNQGVSSVNHYKSNYNYSYIGFRLFIRLL